MTSDSFIEVVQEAVDRTGMDQVPIEDRTRLLSDNGPGYVSRAFRDYLGMVGIKHILATPFHPQTNGKLERYHQTLKRDVNQLPYELPSDLEAAIVAFVSYYNYRRYHKALGNVTPSDVLKGRRPEILRRRKEVQAQTIQRRRQHNRALRELTRPQSDPRSLGSQSVPILLVANKITEDQLDLQRRLILERLETARAKLADYRAQESLAVEKHLLMANIVEWAGKVGDGLDNLSSEERRGVLQLIVDQIVIDRDNNVSITLGIPTEDLVSIEQEESRRTSAGRIWCLLVPDGPGRHYGGLIPPGWV